MKEIWKDIEGYEGRYRVSSYGRVYSCVSEKILKAVNTRGYLTVCLTINRKQTNYKIHRLVALAFLENPENKPQVNHIDGIKTNNNISNLEFVTPSENIVHAHATGLSSANITNRKLTDIEILTIATMARAGYSPKKLSERYKVAMQTIYKIEKGDLWNSLTGMKRPRKTRLISDYEKDSIALMAKKGVMLKDIAKKFNIDPSTVSRIVNPIKNKNLL